MNLEQLNSIGSGGYFPIELTQARDSEGNPLTIDTENGTVPKVGWYPMKGDTKLIKQNLISIVVHNIGQRFRQEEFGTRLYECLEEPNTQVLEFLVKDFIRDSINSWEPRIEALAVATTRQYDKIYISLRFKVRLSQSIDEVNFEYNPQNQTIHGY